MIELGRQGLFARAYFQKKMGGEGKNKEIMKGGARSPLPSRR